MNHEEQSCQGCELHDTISGESRRLLARDSREAKSLRKSTLYFRCRHFHCGLQNRIQTFLLQCGLIHTFQRIPRPVSPRVIRSAILRTWVPSSFTRPARAGFLVDKCMEFASSRLLTALRWENCSWLGRTWEIHGVRGASCTWKERKESSGSSESEPTASTARCRPQILRLLSVKGRTACFP